MTNPTPRPSPLATRALIPEISFLLDLAAILGTTPSGARRIVLHQAVPFLRIGRRIAVRRPALLAWLESREEVTAPRPGPGPAPVAPQWARDLLRRGRRPGLDADTARRGGGR